ncbi:MAG: DUF362 domain-containing protein, partial [Lentisphaerae bacterium]
MYPFTESNRILSCEPELAKKVCAEKGEDAYTTAFRVLEMLADPARFHGLRVLLKPNLGRVAGPRSGVITSPQVIAAATDYFRGGGAHVAVGESPIAGVDLREVLRCSGLD